MRATRWWLLVFAMLSLLLAVLGLVSGSVDIPLSAVWHALSYPSSDSVFGTIVWRVRIPEVATAALAGAGLAAGGLLMQTLFHNPLAGPGVLGITSGSGLGVAVVLMARPLWMSFQLSQDLMMIVAALISAIAVLLLIVLADRRVGDGVTLLIMGLMVGYLCSALVSVLQAASGAEALRSYVLWGMGSFGGMDLPRLAWIAVPVLAGLLVALALPKPLNALLLGEDYARSMGVPVGRVRRAAIWTTGVLAGTITAFCGPIAFLGLATPHVARAFVRTTDHRLLMPASVLLGAALALGCDLLVRASGSGILLPLNAVTSLLGAPVVIWVLLRGRKWARPA
jgi:iron complex transport system permease protein